MQATDLPLWQVCVHTAQLLRATSREKGFYYPDVRNLRLKLRQAYEAFLLQDYAAAQVPLPSLPACWPSSAMHPLHTSLMYGIGAGFAASSLCCNLAQHCWQSCIPPPPGMTHSCSVASCRQTAFA